MNKVFFGDCREIMRRLIAEGVKVQTCVTSPPYWGLRDYGHAGQIGLEPTPEEYKVNLVEVFSLVRDLLSEDGTLWLNLGDTYAAARSYQVPDSKYKDVGNKIGHTVPPGLKQKDLIGIPWLIAFALRSAGWYLRCDIIWNKTNPMPESVTDRPTKSHEYLFLMSKSERYYYDHEAIKEPLAETSFGRAERKQNLMDRTGVGTLGKQIENGVDATHAYAGLATGRNGKTGYDLESGTRNKRSVWTVSTVPYPGSHFAVFPPALIEPCIMAGARAGDIVLDPFFGSGTTGQVAEQLGRQWIGCEIQKDYEPLQKQRTAQRGLAL